MIRRAEGAVHLMWAFNPELHIYGLVPSWGGWVVSGVIKGMRVRDVVRRTVPEIRQTDTSPAGDRLRPRRSVSTSSMSQEGDML